MTSWYTGVSVGDDIKIGLADHPRSLEICVGIGPSCSAVHFFKLIIILRTCCLIWRVFCNLIYIKHKSLKYFKVTREKDYLLTFWTLSYWVMFSNLTVLKQIRWKCATVCPAPINCGMPNIGLTPSAHLTLSAKFLIDLNKGKAQ